MADKTGIEWTDATWNPVTGCDKVSPGCDHCYAENIAHRFAGTPAYPDGFKLTLRPERIDQPLRWKKPRRVFVNSMSDLFHKDVPDSFLAQVFAVMALAPQHTFQILTKRHGRMRSLLSSRLFRQQVWDGIRAIHHDWVVANPGKGGLMPNMVGSLEWPLRNVWMGVSVEDQQRADLRIPALLETPAAIRFLSCEPLLGRVDLTRFVGEPSELAGDWQRLIDWVIVGGESGAGARPMHPEWVRSLRDQCRATGVPFLFKQWGAFAPRCTLALCGTPCSCDEVNASHPTEMRRVGKRAAGRELDGVTHDGYPEDAQ